MKQQSLRRRGIVTSHSWYLWDIFTYHSWLHHFHLSQLATLTFQIWRRREFNFSLLTFGNTNYFKYGAGGKLNFPYSQLATLTISKMAPEGNFPYSQLATVGHFHSSQLATLTFSNLAPEGRESRDRGSGGGIFILEKFFTSPGICLTHYYSRYQENS